ncbi:hypothetical protein DV454_000653 [Geotrichum candidum]|nr:hypothetical protein DV454_000653 [Geotrichum candidum]
MLHEWKIITSRHENLHPIAQVISRLSLSLVLYYLLRTFVFTSSLRFVPVAFLALMVASSFRALTDKNGFAQSLLASGGTSSNGSRAAILSAIAAFDGYKENTHSLLKRRYALFAKLPLAHRQIATEAGYLDRLHEISIRIDNNARVTHALAKFARRKHAVKDYELRMARPLSNGAVIELLNHYVRDWSDETAAERSRLFEPILTRLQKEFPTASAGEKKVLVPGSGLARLAYEISVLGFQTQAQEYSHLMDIAAQFIYEHKGYLSGTENGFELYPYVHEFSHQASTEAQLRSITVPDTAATPGFKKPKTLQLGYGDFTQLATTAPGQYDAVVTLYLIDTAENAMKYLDAIRTLLRPGGVWINFGPLKWGTAPQAEFNLEELERVIGKFNFVIEDRFQGENEYNGDRLGLWQGKYRIRGWVARKENETVVVE